MQMLAAPAALVFESSKANAAAARVRVNRLQRELLETRVAFAAASTVETKHQGVIQYKAVRDAPKRRTVVTEPASHDEVVALSALFNQQLDQASHKFALFTNDPSERTWIRFFQYMDKGGSGQLRWLEFEAMARVELQITPQELSNKMLRAVWAALDRGTSGYVSTGEFGAFMRRGEQLTNAGATTWQQRKYAINKGMADQVRADAENAYDRSVATGVEPASIAEQKALSEQFSRRLAQLHDQRSWIKLFKHMDQEGSGRITFSELAAMIRDVLQFSPRDLPGGVLRAVWAAIDPDALGYINVGEFGAFMRRGEGETPPEVDRIRGGRAEMARWRDRHGRNLQRAQHRKEAELRQRREKIREMHTVHQSAIDANKDAHEQKLAVVMQVFGSEPARAHAHAHVMCCVDTACALHVY